MARQFKSAFIGLTFVALTWTSFCLGQTSPPAPAPENGAGQPPTASPSQQPLAQQMPGSISGTVADQSGAVIAGARVKLTRTGADQPLNREALSGGDGQFSFANIAPGPFQLTVTSAGFATQTSSGTLHSGEICVVPQIALTVATDVTQVQVGLSPVEVAEEQIKIEEKQRVLGVLPNFYVSYIPNAAPLTSKQKFKLAFRTVIDPFTFVIVAGAAGVEQAQNHFEEYGQGAEGYAKRFGAGYADTVAGTFIGAAILPALLKQDPRYFYKGTGSKRSRALNALAQAVICKGDNGHWQANYSGLIGGLAASGISNIYYAPKDRDGAGFTFENTLIGIGTTAVTNLLQEFLIRKLTQSRPGRVAPKSDDPAAIKIPGAPSHAVD